MRLQSEPASSRTLNHLRGVRAPKEAYQRKRFREDPKLIWNESWTETTTAAQNKLIRVWDAGKTR